MKITVKDYTTGEIISGVNLIDGDVYRLARPHPTWYKEYAEALYFVNNADAKSGVIADEWSDDYKTPINPYMTWSLTK